MSERLSAEQLRDVQELPATSAGNVLMRATMRNALLAHISVLEAELQEARAALKGTQAAIAEHRCIPKKVLDDALANQRSQLVAAVRARSDEWDGEDTENQQRLRRELWLEAAQLIEQFNAEAGAGEQGGSGD